MVYLPYDLGLPPLQEGLRFLQISRIKALCEPIMDLSQQPGGVILPTLLPPQPTQAYGGSEFQ
jgi:hypothetical protein